MLSAGVAKSLRGSARHDGIRSDQNRRVPSARIVYAASYATLRDPTDMYWASLRPGSTETTGTMGISSRGVAIEMEADTRSPVRCHAVARGELARRGPTCSSAMSGYAAQHRAGTWAARKLYFSVCLYCYQDGALKGKVMPSVTDIFGSDETGKASDIPPGVSVPCQIASVQLMRSGDGRCAQEFALLTQPTKVIDGQSSRTPVTHLTTSWATTRLFGLATSFT